MSTPVASKPRRGVRPERRRRGDVIVGAVVAVLVLGAAVVVGLRSPVANTTVQLATTPLAAPPPAAAVAPTAFTEAWRAPSAATSGPVVAGPAVVTADGSTVTGHDARTGASAWSYTRDLPLCTAAAAFAQYEEGVGRVLALYENHTGWCSEMTELRPDTGARARGGDSPRASARNTDLRPGTRLLSSPTLTVGTGGSYLEAFRSDLVETVEYGDLPTPVDNTKQPRPGCHYGSISLTAGRLGVVERCPNEATDRLTVLAADGPKGGDTPTAEFSVLLPGKNATLVALTPDPAGGSPDPARIRAAVALSDPARLVVLDGAGATVATFPLDVPAAELGGNPPGQAVDVQGDGTHGYWWTGSRTIALDAVDLTPQWTVPGSLGSAVAYGNSLLVPVPAGLADVDPGTGAVRRVIPVERADRSAPVHLATDGGVLLEQRGTEIVALTPSG